MAARIIPGETDFLFVMSRKIGMTGSGHDAYSHTFLGVVRIKLNPIFMRVENFIGMNLSGIWKNLEIRELAMSGEFKEEFFECLENHHDIPEKFNESEFAWVQFICGADGTILRVGYSGN